MKLTFFLGNCPVRFGFSFFALLAFCCLFAGIAGGASLLSAIFLHEACHIAAMFLLHAAPASVEITGLGCHIVLGGSGKLSYGRSAVISLAGPLGNLFAFLSCAALGMGACRFAMYSLAFAVLHGLPIEPLDGALALRSLLSIPLGAERAEKCTFCLSVLFLLPLSALGFLVLLQSRRNFSLLALCVYLMLCLVLKRDRLIS